MGAFFQNKIKEKREEAGLTQKQLGDRIVCHHLGSSIDELLGVPSTEGAVDLDVLTIYPFENHPFKVIDDEKMEELVESIKESGVLTPVLVRPDDEEIPKELLTGKIFSSLSASSKMLYAVLLDRMSEARKHNWLDDENRVYIIYPLSKLEEDINFSRHTIIDCMNELEEFGLIYKLQSKGKPSKIYVKNFNQKRRFQLIG